MRHFGVTSRVTSGAQPQPGSHMRDNTPRNLSDGEHDFFADDRDFGALIFALGAFASPLVIGGIVLIVLFHFS